MAIQYVTLNFNRMLKLSVILSGIFLLTVAAENCNGKKLSENDNRLKGRLEIKALCMNYTISLVSGTLSEDQMVANWTDESTGKTYKNVFGLGSPCTFPADIQEGDEFYFTIDDSNTKDECAVCMAYYPTPDKRLRIKVLPK